MEHYSRLLALEKQPKSELDLMKKSDLKKILKPLINECIKESLMEDGFLSGIIVEVVKGVSVSAPLVETPQPKADPVATRMRRNAFSTEQTNKLQEHRSELMNAIGKEAYNGVNLFEGTSPAAAQGSPTQQSRPLSGHSPSDPGVDISNLFGAVGRNWNAHMTNVAEEK